MKGLEIRADGGSVRKWALKRWLESIHQQAVDAGMQRKLGRENSPNTSYGVSGPKVMEHQAVEHGAAISSEGLPVGDGSDLENRNVDRVNHDRCSKIAERKGQRHGFC